MRVIVVAHSHGAIIVDQAFSIQAVRDVRNQIEIMTFGTALLLPTSMASKVCNFINEYDFFPYLAATKIKNPDKKEGEEDTFGEYLGNRIIECFSGMQDIFTDMIDSKAHKEAHYLERLTSAKTTFDKTQEGVHPLIAQFTTFFESCQKIAQEEKNLNLTVEQQNERIIYKCIRRAEIELVYHVEILPNVTASADPLVAHSFSSYVDKAAGMITR